MLREYWMAWISMYRHIGIGFVNHIHVDVIGYQSPGAGFYLLHDIVVAAVRADVPVSIPAIA